MPESTEPICSLESSNIKGKEEKSLSEKGSLEVSVKFAAAHRCLTGEIRNNGGLKIMCLQ